MTYATAAAMTDTLGQLPYAESQSKPVGVDGSLMQTLRENAPRIVGGFRLASDLAVASSLNPYWLGFTAFAGTGRVLTMVYGTKENQRKLALEKQQHPELFKTEDSGSFLDKGLNKVLHPREYPVESGAGMAMAGQLFGIGYAASRFRAGGTAYTPLMVGLIGMWSYGNILFGKEGSKDKDEAAKPGSLVMGKSESKAAGISGAHKDVLKDNPVMVSSLVQATIAGGMLAGGIKEKLPPFYLAAGALAMTGCLIQAFFVRKSDFNVEGAEGKTPTPTLEGVSSVREHRESGQPLPV